MKIFIAGASGATGRLVVDQLVERHIPVKVIVRNQSTVLDRYNNHERVEIVRGNIDEYDVNRITDLLSDCTAVVCCLGHTISLKGMYGSPRRLVYNLVKKICAAAESGTNPKRFILMSTTAYTNRRLGESMSGKDAFIFGLLKLILPPHTDNMLAGDVLVEQLRSETELEWVAVRPDSLIDETEVKAYEVFQTKQRNPLTDPGKTSRIQVAHFMADLLSNNDLWQQWVYKTPVIYSKEYQASR